jgi:flagellar protein FliO/FliZ
MNWWELFGLLIVFALVLFMSYLTTKFIGKKYSGRTMNKNMKVIETLPLGMDRSLYLILVGKKYFLFLSSKKGLELVSEIQAEELLQEASSDESNSTNVFDFKRIFESYSGLGSRKPETKSPEESSGEEETRNSGILGGIRRLRRMNNDKK